MLAEYERAPDVTRQRLYLDAMESVLSKTSKVLVDTKGNNSVMYLPIDQLLKKQNATSPAQTPKDLRSDSSPETSQDIRNRLDNRARGSR